jgi:hypothetical protein
MLLDIKQYILWKVTMKVFNEEMCLLLKACGLFYAEAIVILVTTKGSLNISVQSHSSKFIICRHLIFPLEIFLFPVLWQYTIYEIELAFWKC